MVVHVRCIARNMKNQPLSELSKLSTVVIFAYADIINEVSTQVASRETLYSNKKKALANLRSNPETFYILRDAMINEAPKIIFKFILCEADTVKHREILEKIDSTLPEPHPKMDHFHLLKSSANTIPSISIRISDYEGLKKYLYKSFQLSSKNALRKAYPKKSIINETTGEDVNIINIESYSNSTKSPFPDFCALVADCSPDIRQRVDLYLTQPDLKVADIAKLMDLSIDKVKKLNAIVKKTLLTRISQTPYSYEEMAP